MIVVFALCMLLDLSYNRIVSCQTQLVLCGVLTHLSGSSLVEMLRWTSYRPLSRYLLARRTMSAKAYIIPYDHKTTGAVVEGLDATKLWSLTPQGEKPPKVGTTRIFYNTPSASQLTALSSLGDGYASKNANQQRELVRKSIGNAVKDLKNYEGIKEVVVDASLDPHAAGKQMFSSLIFMSLTCFCTAVAAHLALYKFTLKTSPPSRFNPNLAEPIPEKFELSPLNDSQEWNRGVLYAQAQNLARTVLLFLFYFKFKLT